MTDQTTEPKIARHETPGHIGVFTEIYSSFI